MDLAEFYGGDTWTEKKIRRIAISIAVLYSSTLAAHWVVLAVFRAVNLTVFRAELSHGAEVVSETLMSWLQGEVD